MAAERDIKPPTTLCGYPIVFSEKGSKLPEDIVLVPLEDLCLFVTVRCGECGWSEDFDWGEVKKITGKTVECPGCGQLCNCPEEAEFLERRKKGE